MSQYRRFYECWAHVTTITNCHAPNAPLLFPKEMVTFTPYCHLLCQVKQRTGSFNALVIPVRIFTSYKSSLKIQWSKSKKNNHVELLTAKLCVIVCKWECFSCANRVRDIKNAMVLQGVMLYCARPEGSLQTYLHPLHWVDAGQQQWLAMNGPFHQPDISIINTVLCSLPTTSVALAKLTENTDDFSVAEGLKEEGER